MNPRRKAIVHHIVGKGYANDDEVGTGQYNRFKDPC